QVVAVPVLSGQWSARGALGPGGLPAGRDVGVFGEEYRVLPPLLDHLRHCARIHAIVCREIADAKIHAGESRGDRVRPLGSTPGGRGAAERDSGSRKALWEPVRVTP